MWSFGTTMTMAKDEPSAAKPSPTTPLPLDQEPPRPSVFSQRSLKQLSIFFAGAGFLSLSTLITRRAIVRKRIATIPKFYTQSNMPVHKMDSDGPFMAMEALNLATLNIVSFAIMATGGVGWAFDISNIDDLRRKARRHIGPAGGKTDEEAEREIEEWVAKVILRSQEKEKGKEETKKETQSSGEKGS
ncbi:hypothetical protein F4810DRAFT_291794 [Camillea tinctor]|nr:hypothetical protein F4810DRAFT_291794 [Camillea tinctor]